jgi:hypothetical protein
MELKGQFWELFLCFHPMGPEFPTSIPVCGLFFVFFFFFLRDCVYVTLADLELPM